MKQDYTDIVEDLSQLLSSAIQEREINLADSVSQLDGELAELLRKVGWRVMSMLLNTQAEQVTEEAKKTGAVVNLNNKWALKHLVDLVAELNERDIGLRSLNDPIDTTTAQGRLVFLIENQCRLLVPLRYTPIKPSLKSH